MPLHFCKKLHYLFSEKSRNSKSIVDKPLGFNKFGGDERLVIPESDKL